MESIVTLQKPTQRVALPDWHGRVWELRQTCDTRRADALQLRAESRILRNETESKTCWDTYHNNARLADRVTEVRRWHDTLFACMKAVEKEMMAMKEEKSLTEAEIEFLALSFTVVNECLTQRDQRGGADLCTDEAEIEIKHELKLLEALKAMLTEKCSSAWEQINRLEEVRFKLEQDLRDKEETIALDEAVLGLDKHSANISFKPDPLRIPSNVISYECWSEHCKYLKIRADNELTSSQRLRESMYVPRERARNDLKAQNDATNFALRKRIFETQRIKNELEWQRLNMVRDMERLSKDISAVEEALAVKTNAQKLAETRVETRLYRPGAECVRDEPALGLMDEVGQLRQTRGDLAHKLDLAKATLNALEEELVVIDRELYNKNHALSTDLKCLDLRARLSSGERAPPDTQTDRNIVLARMKDEIPPE